MLYNCILLKKNTTWHQHHEHQAVHNLSHSVLHLCVYLCVCACVCVCACAYSRGFINVLPGVPCVCVYLCQLHTCMHEGDDPKHKGTHAPTLPRTHTHLMCVCVCVQECSQAGCERGRVLKRYVTIETRPPPHPPGPTGSGAHLCVCGCLCVCVYTFVCVCVCGWVGVY